MFMFYCFELMRELMGVYVYVTPISLSKNSFTGMEIYPSCLKISPKYIFKMVSDVLILIVTFLGWYALNMPTMILIPIAII